MDTVTLIAPSDIDHLPRVRAQIVEDVKRLKSRLIARRETTHTPMSIVPDYVLLGYAVNSYHGHEIFKEGEEIEGIPVRFDRSSPNSIEVCADKVKAYRAGGEYCVRSLSEQTVW